MNVCCITRVVQGGNVKERIKIINHFNPYAIWFVLAIVLPSFLIVVNGYPIGIQLFIFSFFVIETLFFNFRQREYIRLTNSEVEVLKSNVVLIASMIIYISIISLGYTGFWETLSILIFGITVLLLYLIMYDVYITEKKQNKHTFLVINTIMLISIFTFNRYLYEYLISIIMLLFMLGVIVYYGLNRENIRMQMNRSEAVITLLLTFGLYILTTSYAYSISSSLIFGSIKLMILAIVFMVNIWIIDLIWETKLKQKFKSNNDFFLNVLSLISLALMGYNLIQIFGNPFAMRALLITVIIYICLMIVRRRRGLNVWL